MRVDPPNSLVDAIGHLALWAGCYAAGCVIYVSVAVGVPVDFRTVLIALLAAVGTYLLDRVGPMPGWPDRADVAAVPERVRFLRRRMPMPRVLAAACLMVSWLLAFDLGSIPRLIVPGAVMAMWIYAHVPQRRRPKDVLVVKNLIVAGGLVAMSLVLVAAVSTASASSLAIAGLALLFVTCSGAMLCDLDDCRGDARRGTLTIPILVGTKLTWWIADALVLMGGAILLGSAAMGVLRWEDVILLAAGPVVLTGTLHAIQPRRVRHAVDILIPLGIAAIAMSG